jgi:hypothetical protein
MLARIIGVPFFETSYIFQLILVIQKKKKHQSRYSCFTFNKTSGKEIEKNREGLFT